MSEYIVVIARAWLNESGHGTSYYSDMVRHPTREQAIADGFEQAESDDFNIATVSGRRLLAIGWMHKDFTAEDGDLVEVGRQLCLEVACG